MFDFAWSEIALTGLVAVLVLGPKELPQAMRAMGRFTRQARKLAGEFQGHVNDLVREAELEELKNSVQKVTSTNVSEHLDKFLDPNGEFASELARTEAEMKTALENAPPPPPSAPAEITSSEAAAEAAPIAGPATEPAITAMAEAVAAAPAEAAAPEAAPSVEHRSSTEGAP